MQRKIRVAVLFVLLGVVAIGCGCSSDSQKQSIKGSGLISESDSLAYIIGLNVADQLYKMDSTINVTAVCRAILERAEGRAVMNDEEARLQYLRYLLFVEPERRRGYEERYLADMVLNDRSFTRTKSGLTYRVEVIGDEKLMPRGANDWITVRYSIARVGGEELVVGREESAALSDFPTGVVESMKLIGNGGKILSWIPSKLAYGEEGNEELGIEPIETLYYTIELTGVARGEAAKYKKEQEVF